MSRTTYLRHQNYNTLTLSIRIQAGSLAYFQHNFSDSTKMVYRGEMDDGM